jgi:hypothetical protein
MPFSSLRIRANKALLHSSCTSGEIRGSSRIAVRAVPHWLAAKKTVLSGPPTSVSTHDFTAGVAGGANVHWDGG